MTEVRVPTGTRRETDEGRVSFWLIKGGVETFAYQATAEVFMGRWSIGRSRPLEWTLEKTFARAREPKSGQRNKCWDVGWLFAATASQSVHGI